MNDNPLLSDSELPPFSAIRAEHVVEAVSTVVDDNRLRIAALLDVADRPGWDTLVQPMEDLAERLNNVFSPVSHLHGVCNNEPLRHAYDQAVALLTDYSTELGQNTALAAAYRALQDAPEFAQQPAARRKAVEHALRDFRLAGVELPPADKQRFADIQKRLAELGIRFSNNVLDATRGYTRQVTDPAELAGVPESVTAMLARQGADRGVDGYLVTLDIPSYLPLMQYADNRELRRELYTAYVTRASDVGPNAGRWDNGPVMDEILALRHEAATLLGFDNYAGLSLATKMAASPDDVLNFLRDLAAGSRPAAELEFAELMQFARGRDAIETLEAWDVPYYSEQLRQQRYSLSQEVLRPWFPAPKVIDGMFAIAAKLFDVRFEPVLDFDSYDSQVTLYRVLRGERHIAAFYLDPYARDGKRDGAWMGDCRVRHCFADGRLQLPVAFLTCNFTPPHEQTPSLLTHNEVTTLFHEFGHGLHHMLTEIDVGSVAGINGVAWDAVELPSQFLENWCWEPEAIALFSGHFETGEPLPHAMLEQLLAARNFQSAMQMVRQLEFSLFDFRLHREYDPAAPRPIQALLDEVRAQVAVVPTPAFNRFQHGFSHIFAGGYAAGYYSYKWAEVLAADAFSLFEETGIFDRATGERFRTEILEKGGSAEPAALFRAFRGREPEVAALLRRSGIEPPDTGPASTEGRP